MYVCCCQLKKSAFLCAKEAEKVGEQLSSGRTAAGRTKVTEKDLSKVSIVSPIKITIKINIFFKLKVGAVELDGTKQH